MKKARISIGTRPSALALAQCRIVSEAIYNLHNINSNFLLYKTSGDIAQGSVNARNLDKSAWIDKLQEALVTGEVDLLIHSSKDVPTQIADNTILHTVLRRTNPFDTLIFKKPISETVLTDILNGYERINIGTSSLRRKTQLLNLANNVQVTELRGNVTTRIHQLLDFDFFDAIVVARAGLERLDMAGLNQYCFNSQEMLPAAGQGTLCVQYRKSETFIAQIMESIMDGYTEKEWRAEREFIDTVGADCKSALGVYAKIDDGKLRIDFTAINPYKSMKLRTVYSDNIKYANKIGVAAGEYAKSLGIEDILTTF